MTNFFFKIFLSIILIISPTFSYVVFRENPVILSNSEAIDLIDEYPITDKSMSIEQQQQQKVQKFDEKSVQSQQQQPLTISDLTTFFGLNENYFGGSKLIAKELQSILGEKTEITTSITGEVKSAARTSSENKSNGNELEDFNSNESTNNNNNLSLGSNLNQDPLSFREILTLLALWHLANAFNDYTMEEQNHPITTIPTIKSKIYNGPRK